MARRGRGNPSLSSPSFGGKFDRLRDVEVGDVTGDGRPEIVVATHDQGVVGVIEKSGGKWFARELDREQGIFVHEVEIGDVDGDGLNEFFVTPSDRNRATFVSQPGKIVMYRWNGKSFEKRVLLVLPKDIITWNVVAGRLRQGLQAAVKERL